MRNLTKAIAIAAMLAFPVASFAQTAPAAPAPAKSAAKAEKSASKKVATKTGTVETGAKVQVHYTTEGSTMTATSISASAPKSSSKKK